MEIKIVTSNNHKYDEIKRILEQFDIKSVWIKYNPMEIQSEYIHEVVIYKAIDALTMIQPPFLVEDSALFIHSLGGFPGPYSSYIYNKIGNKGILKLLENTVNREAEFLCVIACCIQKNIIKIFSGKVRGFISHSEKGEFGFGFDPIFIPEGYQKTLAEMPIEKKNEVSHRGKAVKKLIKYLVSMESFNKDSYTFIKK